MAEKWNMNREACFSVPFHLKAILCCLLKFWMDISTIHLTRVETQSWSNLMLMSEIPLLSICQMMGIIQHVLWARLTQLRAMCSLPAGLCCSLGSPLWSSCQPVPLSFASWSGACSVTTNTILYRAIYT